MMDAIRMVRMRTILGNTIVLVDDDDRQGVRDKIPAKLNSFERKRKNDKRKEVEERKAQQA